MTKYSKNAKLNKALTEIAESVSGMGLDEVKRYYTAFRNEPDYNIAQYGNLLVYYDDIYNFYRKCGYKSTDKFSRVKIWETYMRQVGYVVRLLLRNCNK
jgi:hypothetical protein